MEFVFEMSFVHVITDSDLSQILILIVYCQISRCLASRCDFCREIIRFKSK
jgi:hypothetical protein